MHVVELGGRILLSTLFLVEGIGKIFIREDVIMYMESYGVSGIFFIPAIIFEILFPILLVVGYKTKLVALIMALFTFMVAIIFHTDFGKGMEMTFFLKDLAIAGGFLIIFVRGAGRYSVDQKLNKN
tara:strand:- start:1291 stop:1668 length:378 start_codon:yes stop_codon:yes gene_type:complete